MQEYKKAWRFIKHYKFRLVAVIFFLILYQITAFLSPFIIQEIIDHKLLAIQDPWVEVTTGDDTTVSYDNHIYKLNEHIDNDDEIIGDMSIVLIEDNFYIINDKIDDGTRIIDNDNNIIINDKQYTGEIISGESLKLFYNTIIPSLIVLVICLLIVSILGVVFTYLQNITSAMITIHTTRDARKAAIKKIQEIPLDYVENEPAGKTANRLLSDTVGISTLYTTSISIIFNMGVSLILAYVGMFILNPTIAMYSLLIIPVIIIWTLFYTKIINKIITQIAETDSLMVAKINEIINGIGILKAFNTTNKTLDDFSDLNNEYIDYYMKEQKLHISLGWNGINLFQSLVSGLIIVVFGVLYLKGGNVQPGEINAYYTFVVRIIAPIGILFQQVSALENAKVKINRVFTIYDAKSEDQSLEDIKPFKGDIRFEHVNFAYDGVHNVLNDINLDIKQGEKIGLVGHTGSGKSTMMNLLLQFNDIKDGKIYVDDIDITTITKRTYRKHIGIILQEPILFTGTIYDNIAFGTNIDKEQATSLLKKVGGMNLLAKYKLGVDEPISRKGGNLSLGEKQLISFARILASNPSIIVLDEATANIDTETEEMFSKALEVVAKDRTVIVIAHRLSTIVDSDQIIVLQKGNIIEQGNHNSLIKDNGYYANMYRTQVK